jgi:hypothetical protein
MHDFGAIARNYQKSKIASANTSFQVSRGTILEIVAQITRKNI